MNELCTVVSLWEYPLSGADPLVAPLRVFRGLNHADRAAAWAKAHAEASARSFADSYQFNEVEVDAG